MPPLLNKTCGGGDVRVQARVALGECMIIMCMWGMQTWRCDAYARLCRGRHCERYR
jgi:hypothetical protein